MASLNLPVNIKKLLADQLATQQAEIIANTNAKAVETQVEVISQVIATQGVITADGDFTQALTQTLSDEVQGKITELTTVNGNIDTNVQAINTHVTAENDRVLANIPSNSPIKSIQRGYSSNGTVPIAPVNMDKTVVNMLSSVAMYRTGGVYGPYYYSSKVSLKSATELLVVSSQWSVEWEVIEYV